MLEELIYTQISEEGHEKKALEVETLQVNWKEVGEKIKKYQNLCIRAHGVTYPVQLNVEAAGVTDRFSVSVASPQCGGAGVAIRAAQARPARCGLLQVEEKKTDV